MFTQLNQTMQQSSSKYAIVQGNRKLSYQQLNHGATHLQQQLTNQLEQYPPGSISVMPIMAHRSIEFVVAALACWKLGLAYLPLSPNTPSERLVYILEDCQAPMLLINQSTEQDSGLQNLAVEIPNTQIINWQLNTSEVTETAFDQNAQIDRLAYAIYTSGTTGTPKGCMIGFDSLSPIVSEFIRFNELNQQSKVTMTANVAFDAHAIEIWPALCCGATVHIVDQDTLMHPQLLNKFYHQHGITFSWLPTPIAQSLMSDQTLQLPATLHVLMTAGERLTTRPPAHWQTRVVNAYGPTETTVIATAAIVSPQGQQAPNIGKPLPGINCVLLDSAGQPVEQGKQGELFIAGIGVSRGYINKNTLTAEKFVELPTAFFSDSTNDPALLAKTTSTQRAYASGDICITDENNQLHFVSRIDEQLKLDGHRIEPAEIEYRLSQCQQIVQAVVLLQTVNQRQCLCAFYTTDSNTAAPVNVDAESLKATLAKSLPEYMIPKHFVALPSFPLTANGKVDTRQLAVPVTSNKPAPVDKAIRLQLSSEQQQFLRLINQSINGDFDDSSEPTIGWHDDFFTAGGTSVMAINLASQVFNQLGKVMTFKTLYQERTAAKLWQSLHQDPQTSAHQQAGEQDSQQHPLVTIDQRQAEVSQQAPLSSSQRSVWYLANLDPTDRAYHAKSTLWLTGNLDVASLKAALQHVVNRHEIFRSTFINDNQPQQVIHPYYQVELSEFDFSALTPTDAEHQVTQLVNETLNQPFDLTQLPLVRWGLAKLPQQRWALVHIEHHIVHDGWSSNLFLDCLFQGYQQHQKGLEAGPMPLQYADFAVTQQQWLQTKQAAEQISFWQQKLSDAPEKINLPVTAAPDLKQHKIPQGQTNRTTISRHTWQQIEAYCQANGVTTFSFTLAALNIVLSRYSGDEDICLGVALANRNWVNAKHIIGMMINTVVMRVQQKPQMTFNALVKQCFDTVMEAQQYQEVPFETVVEAVNPVRLKGRNPIFQVALGFHDSPLPPMSLPDIDDIELVEALDSQAAKFDLSVVVIPRKGQTGGKNDEKDPVTILWEFNQHRMAPWFIDQMHVSMLLLIDHVLADSNSAMPLHQLPITANAPSLRKTKSDLVAQPTPDTINLNDKLHELIAHQAQQTPNATALVCDAQRLSYQALEQSANRLAHYLVANKVKSGDIIPLMLEKSFDTIIAILAVMKVGAAYLPINTDTPAQRIRYMLADAKPPLILGHQICQALCQQAIESSSLTQFVAMDSNTFASNLAEFADEFEINKQALNASDSQSAYVIYTSGSTGKPKGVEVSHKNLINLTYNLKQLLQQRGIVGHYRWCWSAPYIFDASLQGLSQLAFGCELHLIDEQTRNTPTLTAQYLHDNAIDLLDTTPALLDLLLSQGLQASQHLPNILVGGDAIDQQLWQKIANITTQHGVKAINVYGPTECTVDATFADITADSLPNIGQPFANISAHILDRYGREVPPGAIGELWLGGECVTKGYLNNPQLTEQSFSKLNNHRCYKTADLVSLDPQNQLLYHGRCDNQVKFNGYRIELGEIESVLRRYTANTSTNSNSLSEALVVMRDIGSNQQLVAYVVLNAATQNNQVVTRELHHHCTKYLPKYMVPSHFVLLSQLPLTASGKLDRQALPPPETPQALSKREKTVTEEQLYQLYQPMLGGSEFDIDEDFFRIGGQSLMAMRLLVLIEKRFDIVITIVDFNALSSLSQVAAYIDAFKQPEMEEDVIEEFTI